MRRLIDADALKQAIEDRYESARLQVLIRRNGKTIHEGIAIGLNFARNAIIDQPTVEDVQVVRCKDCKYMRERHYENPGEEPYIKCACESKYGLTERYMVNEWDYCSRGERRTD